MDENDGTMAVLQQLEAGRIDVAQAVERLETAGQAQGGADTGVHTANAWRLVPFGAGLALSAGGGWIASQGGWWWLLAVPLLLAGLPLLLLAALDADSPWIRIRVRHARGTLGLAIPIPVRLAAWGVRLARPWLRGFDDVTLDEIHGALSDALARGGDWFVDIDDRGEATRFRAHRGAQGRPQ
jgi:hypothetical protein